jgi:hypothetical protein
MNYLRTNGKRKWSVYRALCYNTNPSVAGFLRKNIAKVGANIFAYPHVFDEIDSKESKAAKARIKEEYVKKEKNKEHQLMVILILLFIMITLLSILGYMREDVKN